MIADWANRWVPGPHTPIAPITPSPWPVPYPTPIPEPPFPTPWKETPKEKLPSWTREQYQDLMEILHRVKDMEDKLGGCPCEDESKMNFLKQIKEYLDANDALPEKKAADDKPIRYAYPTDRE